MPHPPLPPKVRPATVADIPRMGLLFLAAFRDSPRTAYQRPYYPKFPSDTLTWYTNESGRFLADPKYIALVAVDGYDPDEASKTPAIVAAGEEKRGVGKGVAGEEVIVGIGIWNVGEERGAEWRTNGLGSMLKDAEIPPAEEYLARDRYPAHYESLRDRYSSIPGKYFSGLIELEMLVTHPAYHSRGHGKAMVKWGIEYGRMNKVGTGITAADLGTRLYLSLGFKLLETLEWEGDEVSPLGMDLKVVVMEAEEA